MVAFSRIAEIGELLLEVLLYSNSSDIYRLRRTSKVYKEWVDAALLIIFNLHRRLSFYFNDPVAFRLLQSRTGTVISGSFAVQFFRRVRWKGSDLDLYLPKAARQEVGQWLIDNGYVYSPRGPLIHDVTGQAVAPAQAAVYEDALEALDVPRVDGQGYLHGVLGVMDFVKYVEGDLEHRKVQMVVVEECPMATIMNFHSSEYSVSSYPLILLTMLTSVCDECHHLQPGLLFVC